MQVGIGVCPKGGREMKKFEILRIDEPFYAKLVAVYGQDGLDDQLKQMDLWLVANPLRQKLNYKRFVVNWLNRAAREWAENRVREVERERELRVGTGPDTKMTQAQVGKNQKL